MPAARCCRVPHIEPLFGPVRGRIPSRESALETFLQASLGPTLTAELIDPVLRKLYGHASSELAPSSSIFYFGLNRVTILDAEATNRLRENEVRIDAFEQAASIDEVCRFSAEFAMQ